MTRRISKLNIIPSETDVESWKVEYSCVEEYVDLEDALSRWQQLRNEQEQQELEDLRYFDGGSWFDEESEKSACLGCESIPPLTEQDLAEAMKVLGDSDE